MSGLVFLSLPNKVAKLHLKQSLKYNAEETLPGVFLFIN